MNLQNQLLEISLTLRQLAQRLQQRAARLPRDSNLYLELQVLTQRLDKTAATAHTLAQMRHVAEYNPE